MMIQKFTKAPLACKIAAKLLGKSPAGVVCGCSLGRRRVLSYPKCKTCDEYWPAQFQAGIEEAAAGISTMTISIRKHCSAVVSAANKVLDADTAGGQKE